MIDEGLAPKMMLDWLAPCMEVGNDDPIWLLAPASQGCGGLVAPLLTFSRGKGRCVFLIQKRCAIHDRKPVQCRATLACVPDGEDEWEQNDNYAVARLWDNDEARALILRWEEIVGRNHNSIGVV